MTAKTATATVPTTQTKPLNPRQQAFCRNVVTNGGNATKAYEDAGYSSNGANVSASKLLANPSVKAEIASIRDDLEIAATVDRAYVITKLRNFAENGEKESNRIKATELLGKTLRMFVEKVDVQHTAEITELQGFPLDELIAMRELMETAIEVEAKVLD